MEESTYQGLQNQMFGVFIILLVLVQLILQTLPAFVTQRTLYEARERQSKTYSWQAFLLTNMFVELVWYMVSVAEQPLSLSRDIWFRHIFPPPNTNMQYCTLSSCPSSPSCAGITLSAAIGTPR